MTDHSRQKMAATPCPSMLDAHLRPALKGVRSLSIKNVYQALSMREEEIYSP